VLLRGFCYFPVVNVTVPEFCRSCVQAEGCWSPGKSRTSAEVSLAALSRSSVNCTASMCGTTFCRPTRFSSWRRPVVTLATWWRGQIYWPESRGMFNESTRRSAPVESGHFLTVQSNSNQFCAVQNYITFDWFSGKSFKLLPTRVKF